MNRLRVWTVLAVLALAGCAGDPYRKGLELERDGQFVLATEFFQRLTAERPQDPRAFHELGFAYSRLGMYEDAAKSYTQALKLKPDYAESLGNLGYVYLQAKQPADAQEPLEKAIALNPDCEGCHANLAWVFWHLRQPDRARAELETAKKLSGGKNDYAEMTAKFNSQTAPPPPGEPAPEKKPEGETKTPAPGATAEKPADPGKKAGDTAAPPKE